MATTITIRHVPDDVRNQLAARAAWSGRSLQEYMLREITQMASKPSLEEIVAEAREEVRIRGTHLDVSTLLADRDADRR